MGSYDQATYKCLDDIRMIVAQNQLKRIVFLTPFAPTITTTPTSIFSSTLTNPAPADVQKAAQFSQAISIKVQSMGTATAINIGTVRSQTSTLTSVGDVFVATVPWGTYFNAGEIFVAANLGTTSILEVSGFIYPVGQTKTDFIPSTVVG